MNCQDVRPILLDYVMEEVPAQAGAAIASHLETCAECSQEVGKIRQTLGVVTKAAAFEDVPQRIRIAAEPASRWAAFWLNPARLAFAGGMTACLAVAMLALARTTVTYQDGNFKIAFGAAATAAQSPAAAPLSPSVATLASAPSLEREEVIRLIAEAVAASETRQIASASRLVRAAADEADANRQRDREELAESFRYFQAAQVNMWKQQVENQQVVSALIQRAGFEEAPRP